MNRAQDAAQRKTFFTFEAKKLLELSSAKLTALSIGLLLAVFCTIGMSFRPVYDENEAEEIVMSGPRRSHWDVVSSGCLGDEHAYHNKTDYARTVAKSMNVAYGTVAITANSKNATPITAADGSQSYVDWDTGIGSSETTDERKDLEVIHTNIITFSATPTDPDEYYFVGWYSDAAGNTQVSTDNPWEDVEVKFPNQAGFTSYKDGSGVTTYEKSSTRYTVTYYAKFAQIPAINVTFLAASTSARNNGYYTVAGKGISETNITTSNQTIGVKSITLTAHASEMAEFVRWYTEDGAGNRTTLSEENPCVTSFTAATKVGVEWRELTNHHKITFLSTDVDANGDPVGSYTVDAQTVNTSNYVYNTGDAYKYSPTLTATQASDYIFTGWYTKHGKKKDLLSTSNPWNPTFTQDTTIYAGFAFNNYTDDQKAQFKVGSTYYTDLNAANSAAGSNGTIICTRDGILPPGNYTISSGVTLYIPYNTSETPITKPAVLETATALSAYRTLTFTEGANINVNGNICVGGQIMAGTGSTHTGGYPHGACGMIDMSKGGHIELNDGANLYAWGFVKGQDMDQGNNTINVGTVTANSGSAVWEDFSYGDFRGGSACGTIKGKESSWKFFPFQSYSIHNVEIPVTFKYGSADKNYTCLKTGLGTEEPGPFIIIGSSNSLFKLKDSKSTVRKWYDPTTDLMCYELSGTSQLDALEVEIYVSVNSANYNLPIASNMHIILADCDMTLSKPMLIQPGAVIEIKNGALATLSSNMYLFDVDNWGMYVYGAYFKPFKNLTSHKNRGDGSSKDLLDDAKLIVDGTLNVTGKLYSTAGGANIMGNGGGKINFSTLPSATNIVMCTSTATSENVAVASANLCNDDASYTKSIASTTFYNVHGRWFTADDKDEKENHTYKFTYITSGAVSGTGGTSDWTPAVYSWDKKAALDLTQKWHNVTADACSNWWVGTDTYFYNWTESSDWHQFIPTATEGMYSGSNNKIYTKTDCVWEELGETDVNCLYTIGGVKKALVDGQFLELVANAKDPAYHLASDENRYFICFSGCNWHEATKYANAEKAYVIGEDIFIWYDGAWMNAEWKEPFFYTLDETDVPIYYEYLNGEWVLSDPYIRVIDGLENRTYWFLDEAFAFASGSLRTSPTIKILRDISGISTAVSYTKANGTCTLDLNGHTITGDVSNMITVNAAGCTFTITDNSANENGKINLVFSVNNSRRRALYVQNGHVILEKGTIASTNTLAYSTTNTKPYAEGVLVANGKQFTMNGGRIEVSSAYNPYGIEGASGTPTINIKGGTIETIAETKDSPYAIYSYGTINVTGGTINAIAKASSSAMGVYVVGNGSTANISGGAILARATSSAQGARCWGSATVTADYNAETPDNTPKSRSYSIMNITGGTITAECTTSTTSYGVLSYGTTNISGGTITSTVQKSNQNTAYGVCVWGGTTTIKSGANITANAPTVAYGTYCSGAMDGTRGWCHFGILKVEGGTITANTTNTTKAYGLGVSAIAKNLARTDSYKVFNGDYAAHGEAIITGGTFIVNAKTTIAMGIFVDGTKTLNAASATPVCTINGGYYKATGTGDLSGCNNVALPANFQINGGYYSHNGNLATYAVSPKQVVTLLQTDPNRPDYEYKVAEAYTVTFKNGDAQLQSGYQEVGKSPVYEGDAPTKASTTTASYVFDGWSTTNGGALVSPLPALTSAGATYYAHFAETTLKYMATFDAKTNGGNEDAQVIYVEPAAGVGTLPTATKTGYTFNGWYTAASGGTGITSATVPTGDVTYFAQFSVNSYTLTWNLDGGTVSTAGKYGSTSWPAKNATGAPSVAVPYGSALTAPAVTKTGYTFVNWGGAVATTMPAEALTYTAAWRANTNTKYTVKHYQQNVDGTYPTEPTETEALTGTTAVSVTPAVKSYEGFISPATQTKTIAADGKMVVEYQYRRIPYTIEWNAYTNGGTCATPSSTVLYGATLGSMPTATKTGLRFDGWYTQAVGGVQITETTPIMQNYGMLYAQFVEVPTYSVTFDANGHGTAPNDQEIEDGEKATEPTAPSEKGYTFGGWYKEDACTNAWNFASDVVTGETTLFAKWTPNTNTKYTVKHYQQNVTDDDYTEVKEDQETKQGTTATSTAATAKSYTGFAAQTITQETIAGDGSTVVSVYYNRNTVAVTWNWNESGTPTTYTDNNVRYGATAAYTYATPTKPSDARYNYTFTGWSDGTNTYAVGAALPAVTAATTYTATFSQTENKYTVSVAAGANGAVSPASVSDIGCETASADITATPDAGYTFNGWTLPEGVTAADGYTVASNPIRIHAIAADKTITANFVARNDISYTVKHYQQNVADDDYTEVTADQETLQGTTATLTAATAKSYTGFTAQPFSQETIAGEGTTVVNIYYDRNKYTVTWVDGNGNIETDENVKFGATPVYNGGTPPKTGTAQYSYTFNGWYPEVSAVVGNATYTATFTETVNTYTITWKNKNGDILDTDEVAYGATPVYDGTPTQEPTVSEVFTFRAWTPEISSVTGDATYTADYTASVRPYPVKWVNYDGTVLYESTRSWGWDAPTADKYKGETPIRQAETGKNYTFIGWSEPVSVVEGGDVTYTALFGLAITADEEHPVTISGPETASVTTVKVSGKLNVSAGSLTTTDLILEASTDGSGDITGVNNITVPTSGHVYFDYTFDTDPWHWSSFGVPFEIDLAANAPLKETTQALTLGSDYDIVYYDSHERATNGANKNCWKYVEKGNKKLTPGVLYLIAFNKNVGHVNVLRFTKATDATIDYAGEVSMVKEGTGTNANWNGIANPKTYHAILAAGTQECQVHDGGEFGKDGYHTYTMKGDEKDYKFFVGKAAFVQVPKEQISITVSAATDQDAIVKKAPRRAQATVGSDRYDIMIAPQDGEMADRLFILAEEDKADEYVIVADLAKAGVSPVRAQMWVNRYGEKLCKNTAPLVNSSADYPLGISVPQTGEYEIYVNAQPAEESVLYLTFDGKPIWNLNYGGYITTLDKGTTERYGLRLVKTASKIATGVEELTVENGENIRKVLVDDKIYIIRNGKTFTVTGQTLKY